MKTIFTDHNSSISIQECISRASSGDIISLCGTSFEFFESNAYHFHIIFSNADPKEQRNSAIYLENIYDLTIDGNGAELIFHGALCSFVLNKCEHVTLKNFTIDWKYPLDAEGCVTHTDKNGFTVFIDPEKYPWKVDNERLFFLQEDGNAVPLSGMTEFDPVTLRVPPHTGDRHSSYPVQSIDASHVYFHCPQKNPPITSGTLLLLRHSDRAHPAIVLNECSNITLENINIHSSAGLGALIQFSQNTNIKNVRILPNRTRDRKVLSSHVDGFQFCNCRGNVSISNCAFHGLLDDCINIHGTSTVSDYLETPNTLLAHFGHCCSKDFPHWASPGDIIGFLNPEDMFTVFHRTVASYEALGASRFRICFTEPLPESFTSGMVMENESATPNVSIKHCFFASGRARGLLLSTRGKCTIHNNTFLSSGSAILMAGDASRWYESGACKNVEISGNLFDRCNSTSTYQYCGGVISLWPDLKTPSVEHPFHTGIQIHNNHFIMISGPALYAAHCDEITFTSNTLYFPPDAEEVSPAIVSFHSKVEESNTVILSAQ